MSSPNTDWYAEEAQASDIDIAFNEVCRLVRSAVAQDERARPDRVPFMARQTNEESLAVSRQEASDSAVPWVAFHKNAGDNKIEVRGYSEANVKAVEFIASRVWSNDEHRYRLMVGRAVVKPWEIVRRALVPLFFG